MQAERAQADGDGTRAALLLSDLHWFAHADAQLHQAVHRLGRDGARQRGELAARAWHALALTFAGTIARVEALQPAFEVVQTIAAPPERVYEILADVAAYAEWNPWVVELRGTAGVGDTIAARVKLGARTMKLGHEVLVAEPGARFGWCDRGWFTVFASGRRLRWLEPAPDGGTRLISAIQLYGPFAHLAWQLHGKIIRDGMTAEAHALAQRAAALATSAPPVTRARRPHDKDKSDGKPLAGTTCAITGATHGIGVPTALALGELGARMLLLCRERDKGEAVAQTLRARGAVAEVVPVDLASLQSVVAAAARVRELAPRLELLINNAGVLNHERRVTQDGFEEGFGVNFLAHVLLTHELLPSLGAAASARIVHLTSNTHAIVPRFDFDDYNWQRRRFSAIPAYAHSKLAVLLFNRSLARRLAGTRITSNAVHPGIIATGMGTNHPRWGKILTPLVRPIFVSPDAGALTTIYVAASAGAAAHNGDYFVSGRAAQPGRAARDDDAAARLQRLAESLLAERGLLSVERAA
jgi:NAD(P)-dependent dehydrogenase (short-subunit alcohol dehydrogenase family)/uncharacterized protein YndB with AHSA1/START domain